MPASPNSIRNLRSLANLMDARFRIPGTNIRFGMDAIIGIIPGVGDLVSLVISGYIISIAKKNGASQYVIARMMLNSGIDAVIGAIPILGDIFDVGFKANQRNLRLLHQHFEEGRHLGSAAKVVVPVAIVLIGLVVAFMWGMYELITWVF